MNPFFWGWVIFYLIFKNQGINKIKIEKILILLCLLTLSEAVLINTLVQPFDLPNYPNFEDGKTEWVSVGLYQRPYSFGASASVGSSLLVVASFDGKLQAVDPLSLKVVDHFSLGYDFSAIFSDLVIYEDFLAVYSSRNRLYLFR